MKNRNQIADKYKWDLTQILPNDDAVTEIMNSTRKQIPVLAGFKGKLGDKKQLFKFLEKGQSLSMELEKASMYAYLKWCEDTTVAKYNKMMDDINTLMRELGIALAFENDELLSYGDEYLLQVANDAKFAKYSLDLKELVRSRPHILDEKSNQIMAKVGHFAGDFSDIFDKFDSADIKFDDITDSSGKSHSLDSANYTKYIESPDRTLRRNAFNSMYKSFMNMVNTIGANYLGSVKSDAAYSNIYNFASTRENDLFADNIDESVYNKLIEQVHAHLPLIHKYYRLCKKMSGLKDFTHYDLHIKPNATKCSLTFEQDVEIAKSALLPMGEDYVKFIDKAVSERWIDVYPNKNKSTGGFCIDCYDVHPYILLNNQHTLNDLSTFVHEFGHAMHSYYSNKHQPSTMAQYSLVQAEIASTTNEVLLSKYLYNHAKTDKEKLVYLDMFIKDIKSTVFRQAMFSEFEDYAHRRVEAGDTPTVQELIGHYRELVKEYHGSAVKHCKEIDYEWMRVSHFYRSYYVYKYATSMVSAICIASNILNNVPGALDNYYKFLCSGGSMYPLDCIKLAGVDLASDEPYEIAFAELKWAIDEMEKLIK